MTAEIAVHKYFRFISKQIVVNRLPAIFRKYGSYKGFKQIKWPSRSFKVVGIGAIQKATYDVLLVSHCIYVSILHRFPDIITYLP